MGGYLLSLSISTRPRNLEPMDKPNTKLLWRQLTFPHGDTFPVLSTPLILHMQMTTLYESFLNCPKTIMTLTSDHDYPKILKDMMKHIHLEGDAVYKGY